MRIDVASIRDAYLKFDVHGVGGSSSAVLRLYSETSSSTGFSLHSVSDAWWGDTPLRARLGRGGLA